MVDPGPAPAPDDSSLESSSALLERARHGDQDACNRLMSRYRPRLTRWAHGRLPAYARALVDTDDLVQSAMVRALSRLKTFEERHAGAFLSYLRKILLNEVRDEIRRARRIPPRADLDEAIPDGRPSPLEQAIGRDLADRYDAALEQLKDDYREAIVLRVELELSYAEVADAMGRSSPMAARLLIMRALIQIAKAMRERRSS